MVARIDTFRSGRALENIVRTTQNVDKIIEVAAIKSNRVVMPKLLRDLSVAPPRPKRKIEWTTERQRRAYFATNGFGRGIPSRRTGGATHAWRALFDKIGNAFVARVVNPNSYLRFVRYDPPFRRSRIQRFHKITGWRPVNPIFDHWRRVYSATFRVNFHTEYNRRKRR